MGALGAGLLAGTLLTLAWGWYVSRVGPGGGATYELGTFGDAFGPLTTIFNAATLGAAIVAVLLQRRELALQRVEMREARREMFEQRKELTRQRRAAQRHVRAIEFGNQVALVRARTEAARLAYDAEQEGSAELAMKGRDEAPVEMVRQLATRHGSGTPTSPEDATATLAESGVLRDSLYRRPRLQTLFDAHYRATSALARLDVLTSEETRRADTAMVDEDDVDDSTTR